jgi:Bacterial regulatory protein, arsR family
MPKPDLKTKSRDELIAYVVKHPYRVDALAILNERVASIAEIAEIMNVPAGRLEHHIKDLHDAGCIEIVRRERRRGAYEHYYAASLRPNISDEAWALLSQKERLEISGLVFGAIMAEGLGAIRVRTFDSRKDRHLSWRILHLDEEGWLELVEEKAESLERTETIQANSYRRIAESGEEGISVIAGAFAFERAKPGRSEGHGLID